MNDWIASGAALKWVGHFSNDRQYAIGDVCEKDDGMYLYYGDDTWGKLTDYVDMGGNYVNNHYANNHMLRTLNTHPTHCKCCGAVLKSNICEYCGAKYFEDGQH